MSARTSSFGLAISSFENRAAGVESFRVLNEDPSAQAGVTGPEWHSQRTEKFWALDMYIDNVR